MTKKDLVLTIRSLRSTPTGAVTLSFFSKGKEYSCVGGNVVEQLTPYLIDAIDPEGKHTQCSCPCHTKPIFDKTRARSGEYYCKSCSTEIAY